MLFYYNSNFLLICIIDKYGMHAITNMGHGVNSPEKTLAWMASSEIFLDHWISIVSAMYLPCPVQRAGWRRNLWCRWLADSANRPVQRWSECWCWLDQAYPIWLASDQNLHLMMIWYQLSTGKQALIWYRSTCIAPLNAYHIRCWNLHRLKINVRNSTKSFIFIFICCCWSRKWIDVLEWLHK